jgi:hypothetical protein
MSDGTLCGLGYLILGADLGEEKGSMLSDG